ncbi:MAG: hypothetical protein NTV89_00770 [Proteobacteria bacterium]|nr:hypothetical protein [Pseudomonadota bacterium]
MDNVLATLDDSHNREQIHKILGQILINVTNKYFENRDIYIDGYRFINCRFENVRLIVMRGTFEFHSCFINGGFRYFQEEAQKCVQFMMFGLDQIPYTIIPESLRPIKNEDGSISISKDASC